MTQVMAMHHRIFLLLITVIAGSLFGMSTLLAASDQAAFDASISNSIQLSQSAEALVLQAESELAQGNDITAIQSQIDDSLTSAGALLSRATNSADPDSASDQQSLEQARSAFTQAANAESSVTNSDVTEIEITQGFANASCEESNSGIVPCGNGDYECRCTMCHFVVLGSSIMNFLTKILAITGITIIAIAGVMYVVSAGNSGMTTMAKNAIRYVLTGVLVILFAWVSISFILTRVAGADSPLGMVQGPGVFNFSCNAGL